MSVTEDDLDIAAAYLVKVLTAITEKAYPPARRQGQTPSPKRMTPYDCALCLKPIYTDTRIARANRRWVHAQCWIER